MPVYWKPKLPSLKRYFFASRWVNTEGVVAKFSDSFGANEKLWTLQKSFLAYPEKYPGTKVNIIN